MGLLPDPTGALAGQIDCLDSPFVDKTVPYTIGQFEAVKFGLIDTLARRVLRGHAGLASRATPTYSPDDEGQFGLSAKWYAEELGGTEFGFYYQNYPSRLPFAGENAAHLTVAVSDDSTDAGRCYEQGRYCRWAAPTMLRRIRQFCWLATARLPGYNADRRRATSTPAVPSNGRRSRTHLHADANDYAGMTANRWLTSAVTRGRCAAASGIYRRCDNV